MRHVGTAPLTSSFHAFNLLFSHLLLSFFLPLPFHTPGILFFLPHCSVSSIFLLHSFSASLSSMSFLTFHSECQLIQTKRKGDPFLVGANFHLVRTKRRKKLPLFRDTLKPMVIWPDVGTMSKVIDERWGERKPAQKKEDEAGLAAVYLQHCLLLTHLWRN